jgi:putative ABC transport system permease protein
MKESIQNIPIVNLTLAFIPVLVVIIIVWKWKIGHKNSIFAVFRMLLQLLLVGYLLTFIFNADKSWIVMVVLTIMLFSASWISLRTIKIPRKSIYMKCFGAISIGGGLILILITQGVLNLDPWYLPSYVIPLAGMIFANAMNSISLAGERLQAELERNVDYDKARVVALQAALIPITNSLFAVGLVSLPGMMTGQILSGVSPFIAARYQIMVMCMMFGSAGISSALFIIMTKENFISNVKEVGEVSVS